MNLKYLHQYLGELLEAGVSPDIHVVSLVDDFPKEITGFVLAEGQYHCDAQPHMVPWHNATGAMLVALPVGEYEERLREPENNVAAWIVTEAPVECFPAPHEAYFDVDGKALNLSRTSGYKGGATEDSLYAKE